MNDRHSTCEINGVEYQLKMSNLATITIAQEYGSLDAFLHAFDGFQDKSGAEVLAILPDIFKMFCILANPSIIAHNMDHPESQKKKLEWSRLAADTDMQDLPVLLRAVTEAVNKGVRRDVPSETDEDGEKNAVTG